uniref:Uncharacterized protein n=1 Tax=Mayetiola destructor TaxID=39758 RepID=F6KPR6_MAYDE|nr:hypothetical protein [Mayetiola destructor]
MSIQDDSIPEHASLVDGNHQPRNDIAMAPAPTLTPTSTSTPAFNTANVVTVTDDADDENVIEQNSKGNVNDHKQNDNDNDNDDHMDFLDSDDNGNFNIRCVGAAFQIEISVRKVADGQLKANEFVCNSCDSNFDTIMNDIDTEINMDAIPQQKPHQPNDNLNTSNQKQPTTPDKTRKQLSNETGFKGLQIFPQNLMRQKRATTREQQHNTPTNQKTFYIFKYRRPPKLVKHKQRIPDINLKFIRKYWAHHSPPQGGGGKKRW